MHACMPSNDPHCSDCSNGGGQLTVLTAHMESSPECSEDPHGDGTRGEGQWMMAEVLFHGGTIRIRYINPPQFAVMLISHTNRTISGTQSVTALQGSSRQHNTKTNWTNVYNSLN